ncbi:MAG: hypothetical protein KH434_02960 [Clostridium sp.]|nr:hypothetical protein [Clostridium sp.]
MYSSYYSNYPSYYEGYGAGVSDATLYATLGTALGAFLGIFLLFIFIILIIQIVASWKLFNKAGEKGWKSIIPIYNVITLFKISGLSPWIVCAYLLGFIPIVGGLIMLGISIYQSYNLAKSFGKGAGFTVGLVLLPFVFYMILAFGKDEYIGPGGNVKDESSSEEKTAEVVEVIENNDN